MESRKKKTYKMIIFLTVTACVLAVFASAFLMVRNKKVMINDWFVKEENVIGADISAYQGEADMETLKKEGISFLYIKATEGSSYQDPQFPVSWQSSLKADMPAGAYHFFSYDSPGLSQAENYINTVGDLSGRLLPAVDVEYYGDKQENPPVKEDVRRELQAFLNALEEEYGVKAMIYTRPDIYNTYLKGSFDEYPKWISSLYVPIRWVYKEDWHLWQYTDRGRREGYSGEQKYIDLDVLNSRKQLSDLYVNGE